MKVVETIADLRTARSELKGQVGVVPTMGYLHAGHMSLVAAAREANDSVVATIFVNPTQFGEGEDLASYPRDVPRDLNMLREAGVDLVFVPSPGLMYPPGYQTYVSVEQVTRRLEGAHRPGHFRGVTTVVAKLFNVTLPDRAYFGQKDAQQVVVIKRMVRDLNFPLTVIVCPIVREPDGLALSSRNVYLSDEEREAATALSRAWRAAGEAYESGERDPDVLRQTAHNMLTQEVLVDVDYVSLADVESLEEVHHPVENPVLLSMTARVGKPRLLDNCLLPLSLNNRADLTQILGG